MFKYETTISNPDLITAYVELLRHVPDVVNIEMARAANKNAPLLLADLRKAPGAVKYPIAWKSAKQRKAYFATDGFGRGIPTQRSGALGGGWRVTVVYAPNKITSIAARNDVPYRRFVTGEDQQPFHRNTGWQKDDDTLQIWSLIMADDVETGLIRSFYAVGG